MFYYYYIIGGPHLRMMYEWSMLIVCSLLSVRYHSVSNGVVSIESEHIGDFIMWSDNIVLVDMHSSTSWTSCYDQLHVCDMVMCYYMTAGQMLCT